MSQQTFLSADHPFFVAVRNVDMVALRKMLRADGSLAQARVRGDLTLTETVWHNDERVAVDNTTDRSAAAIHFAAINGHHLLISLLIKYRADVDSPTVDDSKMQTTPIVLAVSAGHLAVLLRLLQAGADPNSTTPNESALYTTLAHGSGRFLNQLLFYGARHDIHTAAMAGNVEAVTTLLDQDPTLISRRAKNGRTVLQSACVFGQPDIAELLVGRGAEQSTETRTALGDTEAIQTLIKDDPAVVSKLYSNQPLLSWAIAGAQLQMVELLLQQGADCESVNFRGHSPLRSVATVHRDVAPQIVDRLVKAGAHVDRESKSLTPLAAAIGCGNLPIAQALIRNGADVNLPCGKHQAPLHFVNQWTDQTASGKDCVACARVLLDAGADKDCRDERGQTLLQNVKAGAGLYGLIELLESHHDSDGNKDRAEFISLFSTGSAADAADWLKQHPQFLKHSGPTANPLLARCFMVRRNRWCHPKQLEIAELFIPQRVKDFRLAVLKDRLDDVRHMLALQPELIHAEFTIDPRIRVRRYEIGPAIHHWQSTQMAEVLLDAGADIDALNTTSHSIGTGTTALGIQLRSGTVEGIRFLLNRGANPNIGLPKFIPYESMDEIVGLLVAHGWNINEDVSDRETLLYEAAAECKSFQVRILLNHGADPNVKNRNGRTALHAVAATGFGAETIQPLVDAGADINAVDKNGETALQLAKAARLKVAKHALLRLGALETK